MNQTDALAYLGLKTLPENPDEIKKSVPGAGQKSSS